MAMYGVQPMLPGGPDEDLMGALGRQRSEMATNLQASQAEMGVPGQQLPGSGGGGDSGGGAPAPPSRLQRLFEERRQEMAGIESQQQGVLLGQRLLQALDPRLPKQARQFLFRELSSAIGVDPRGDRSKQLGQMLTSLDPETLEAVRRNVAEQVQSRPGEVVNLVRGVFTGQVPITAIISGMTTQGVGAEGGVGGGPPPSALGPTSAPSPGPAAPGPLGGGGAAALGGQGIVQAALEAGRGQAPGRPGDTRVPPSSGPSSVVPPSAPPPAGAIPPERQVAPINREIAPELAGILGLDQAVRYRNRDVISGGWNRIPTSYEDQQRMANDLRGLQDGVVNSMVMGSQLVGIFRGRPEVLNLNAIRVPYVGDIQTPNFNSLTVQLGEVINGMARSFGWEGTRIDPESEAGRSLIETSRGLTERIMRVRPEIQEMANANAVIQSLLINMAFAMAAAKGQTGRFLSDRDVELQLQELGRSASPEQFEATVTSVLQRMYDQFRVRVRSQTGGDVPIENAVTEDAAESIRTGGIAPRRFMSRLFRTPAVEPSPIPEPTEGVGPPSERQPRPEMSSEIGPEGAFDTAAGGTARLTLPLAGRRDVPLPAAPPLERVDRQPPIRLERRGPTLEQEEAETRSRAEEDRAAALERRRIETGRFELQRSAEERAARVEERTVEEMRRRRIQQAFTAIASALRTSGGASVNIPSGAGGGGDQDAAAFRIAPAPQRRPPAPVEAQRFQRR